MRPTRFALFALVTVVTVSACAAGDAPGWTYAPVPSATAAPSASGEPSGSPSGEPSGDPGAAIELVAANITFDPLEITVPAGEPFSIHFINDDPAGVPHDVDIETDQGEVLQNQDTIDGGEEVTYDYEPLDAGEYVFQCSIHPIPNMTGTLIVE